MRGRGAIIMQGRLAPTMSYAGPHMRGRQTKKWNYGDDKGLGSDLTDSLADNRDCKQLSLGDDKRLGSVVRTADWNHFRACERATLSDARGVQRR